MRKALIKYLFAAILFTGFAFIFLGFVSNVRGAVSCGGAPIYCDGPCDTVWYTCSCDQRICTGETACPGDPEFPDECRPYSPICCNYDITCSTETKTGSCPGGSCINICDGGDGDGGGGNGGGSDECTVDFVPDNSTIANGSFADFTADVTVISGSVEGVVFGAEDTDIATVNPNTDTSSPYETQVSGESEGSTGVTASVQMSGNIVCTDTSNVTVSEPVSWWQVINADVVSIGNLVSQIPALCSGGCNPIFDLDGPGGFPGLPIYSGSYDFSDTSDQGTVSSTGWLAEASYNGSREYKYSYFDRKIPADATLNEIESPSITGSEIDTGGTEYDGYYWYHFDGETYGDLTITDDVTIASDRKVILLVESADLTIQGNVTIQSDGQGFLLVIVGETGAGSKGNIYVDSGVSGSDDGVPEIEGLFMADNAFETGTAGVDSDNQLHIRGSVAAYGGMSLDRDLADDSQTPAEIFEFAPELMLLFPQSLSLERMRWEEVAP